jgi:hypothetical protein
MEYAKEVDIANNHNEYAVGNDGNDEPLAEGNKDNNHKYASAAHCAESIILLATPAESMKLSAIAESIMLSAPPAENMILSVLPTESVAHLHPESECMSMPSC